MILVRPLDKPPKLLRNLQRSDPRKNGAPKKPESPIATSAHNFLKARGPERDSVPIQIFDGVTKTWCIFTYINEELNLKNPRIRQKSPGVVRIPRVSPWGKKKLPLPPSYPLPCRRLQNLKFQASKVALEELDGGYWWMKSQTSWDFIRIKPW